METRKVTKNEVVLESTLEKIKRGDAKDSLYAAILPTEANLNDWVKFHGIKNVVEMLAAQARKDAQATLNYVIPEDKWKKRTVTDPETKKEEEVFYYDDADLDVDKYYETLVSGVARGGITQKELKEQQAEVNAEMAALAVKLATGDPAVAEQMMALGQKWQDLNAAIAAKSRERKSKADVQAEAA